MFISEISYVSMGAGVFKMWGGCGVEGWGERAWTPHAVGLYHVGAPAQVYQLGGHSHVT